MTFDPKDPKWTLPTVLATANRNLRLLQFSQLISTLIVTLTVQLYFTPGKDGTGSVWWAAALAVGVYFFVRDTKNVFVAAMLKRLLEKDAERLAEGGADPEKRFIELGGVEAQKKRLREDFHKRWNSEGE